MDYTDLIIEFAKAFIAIALSFLVPIVTALAFKLLKKAGVELDAELEAMIRAQIRNVAVRIEERAAQLVKAGNVAPTAAMKLTQLTTEMSAHILSRVPRPLRPLVEKQLQKWIHEELPKIGIGALAALRQKYLDEQATVVTGTLVAASTEAPGKP